MLENKLTEKEKDHTTLVQRIKNQGPQLKPFIHISTNQNKWINSNDFIVISRQVSSTIHKQDINAKFRSSTYYRIQHCYNLQEWFIACHDHRSLWEE